MWHPQDCVEPDDQLKRDAEWHISVEDRNTPWINNFLNAAVARKPIKSFIEIGCGTSTMRSIGRERGMDVIGYDTNPVAAPIALARHNIEIQPCLWGHDTLSKKYDLVVCISTLEHVPDPNGLIHEIATYCKRHGSVAFVSVPFTCKRSQWHFRLEPVPKDISNPYYLSDVHIYHFSRHGFEQMSWRHGATKVDFFRADGSGTGWNSKTAHRPFPVSKLRPILKDGRHC
ncbi:MAG: class I SAM-dependent methyltransferase [Hyphomicrobium sp.]